MGERVEDVLTHLWVHGVEVEVAGKGLVGGEGRSLSSVLAGEEVLVARGFDSWAPKHHQATRKMSTRSRETM